MARPSKFTQAIADEICERIAQGELLRTICKSPKLPSRKTVYEWLKQDDKREFRDHYARVLDSRYDDMAEEIIEISDDASNDYVETDKGHVFNSEHVQRSRLRSDNRKWYLSKVAPKKYGDKVQQEITGADGGPVELNVSKIERVIVNATN